jgi:hydrogenase nickel incorporation protein HypA/HybF
MHELSVTESLLEIALRHAEPAGAKRITGLHIVIGQLASIVDDSVQFYWEFVARNTLAEGAQLHFRRIPVELLCQDCGLTYTPGKSDFTCPTCSSEHFKVTAGEEFFLESMDIET